MKPYRLMTFNNFIALKPMLEYISIVSHILGQVKNTLERKTLHHLRS